MKKNKLQSVFTIGVLMVNAALVSGQTIKNESPQEVLNKGAETLARQNGTESGLYWVLFVVLVIWIGLALYLFLIDRKVRSIEKRLK